MHALTRAQLHTTISDQQKQQQNTFTQTHFPAKKPVNQFKF